MKHAYQQTLRFFAKPLPFIGLLTIVATFLRGLFLTKADIWHDEGYSTMIVNYPLGEIITRTINDVHPPFYYLILSIWQSVFGASVVSLRGFSVACGVATVVLVYLLMRRLFSEKIAKLAAVFTAFGPFLVRYSDEARMYALATLLAVLATYVLVVALSTTSRRRYLWWAGYGATIALGLYTQYFFIFLVPAHCLYALSVHSWRLKALLRDKGWWLGNLFAAILFLPWLPHMLAQMSRVQQGFWIPPVSLGSVPHTISQFVTYNHDAATVFGYSLLAIVVCVPLYISRKIKKQFNSTLLLAGWLLLPILFVVLLSSLGRPVYIDRYFSYSAPAFYALLAVAISLIRAKNMPWLKPALISATLIAFCIGIANVSTAATHKMGHAAGMVNREFRQGDVIVSAELYTFFDFSYYNRTGAEVKLLSERPFGSYGEYSLLADRPYLRVARLSDIDAPRVWLVGKTGEHDYFTTDIPAHWRFVMKFEGGDSAVRLYEIGS